MKKGLFISFEGNEGAGKTTQAKLLCDALTAMGVSVTPIREPGGTAIGEAIRGILKDTNYANMTPETELLLFSAARAQLVADVIKPALEVGNVVIADRFSDSTMVYQGAARRLPLVFLNTIADFAWGSLQPALTLLLDIELETMTKRLGVRKEAQDRIEQEGEAFFTIIRDSYRYIQVCNPIRIQTLKVDALSPEEVHQWALAQTIAKLNAHQQALAQNKYNT